MMLVEVTFWISLMSFFQTGKHNDSKKISKIYTIYILSSIISILNTLVTVWIINGQDIDPLLIFMFH